VQHANRQRTAVSLGPHSTQHVESIDVAHIVTKIDHRHQSMLFDQSTDAFAFVGDYLRKQLVRELSTAVPHAMRFGDMTHALCRKILASG
jgi:hypothetical protein